MKETITVPIPLPEPIPGGGGPDTYQSKFNARYYETRSSVLQPFFNGRPGSANPAAPQLSSEERDALADELYLADPSVPFDEQIDYQGWDPYGTQYERQVQYGYTRVPYGTGTKKSNEPIDTSLLVGPVEPGYLLVTTDINKL